MGRKRKERKNEEFSLNEVLKLGGTEEDFEALKENFDDAPLKGPKVKDPLKNDEFKEFFSSIGFDKMDELSSDNESELEPKFQQKKTSLPESKPVSKTGPKTTKSISTGSKKNESEISKKKTKSKKEQMKQRLKITPEKTSAPLQDAQISSTTDDTSQSSKVIIPTKRLPKIFNHMADLAKIMPKKTVCRPGGGQWYTSDVLPTSGNFEPLESNDPVVLNMKDLGRKLLENDAILYRNQKKQDSGNDAWLRTVVTSGTLSDRVAAYTMMLQKAPIHNYRCLETFLAMLKKKGKREALIGLEALRDVFVAELLPDNRRLRFFHQQPIQALKDIFQQDKGGATSKRIEIQKRLICWTHEEIIKQSYKQFVEILRDFFLQDSLEALKTKGMKVVLDLLKSKPEQERELLTMLVNKLGDPKFKIASKGLHMLHCLIQEHPMMQGIVVGAVRDLLLRPNVNPKCQYYCICFLSSQILSHDRKDVADLLIQIYLGFFKAAVKQKRVDNKLLSAILTGVNRAYPFANSDDEKILEELNVLYKTVHISSFGTTVQALMLLFQVLSSRDELTDRYYNALYSSLLHVELPICTNRHPMFLNLIFRSLKADPSESRVKAFLKRLLQTCSLQLAAYTSAVLVLITELMRVKPSLKSYFDIGSRWKETTKDKADAAVTNASHEDSDEEHFVDVDKEKPNTDGTDANQGHESKNKKETESSWSHLHKKSVHSYSSGYDPLHRNPTFANANLTSLWELHRIRYHFHPTVVKFATEIGDFHKSGLPDHYPGNPLQDFTLMRFLDKFVYKNPKARQDKDTSANQGESIFRRKRKIHMADTKAVAANTPEFLQKQSYNPEEVFLQRYFASRAGNIPQSKKKVDTIDDGSDIEEVSDNEFDSFLESTEGKAELEKQYNFADGTTAPKGKKQKMDIVEEDLDDDDEEMDFGDDDDDFGDLDEDPFSEEGMGFNDVDDEDEGPPPRMKPKKNEKKQKSSAADAEAFDLMLEENTHDRFGGSGSGAVRNTDRSSAKQLHWERKKEMKEIIARKRGQNRSGGFSKGKKSNFKGKKNTKFSGKKKFKKGRSR